MMGCIVILGGIVGKVLLAGVVSYIEMFPLDLIRDPEIVLFHGAGAVLFDSVIGDARGRGIVTMDWGGWLGMPQFFQCET